MNTNLSAKKIAQPESVLQEVSSLTFKNQDIDKKISSFTSNIIFRIGKLGDKPLKFIVERFQTLRYKELSTKNLTKIRMTALILLAIPSLAVALPGNVVCGLLKKFSRSFSYSPSTEKTSSVVKSWHKPEKFKTLTWNTGLGPGFMSIDNRLKKPEERVPAIVEMIAQQDPNIVCLQEVFDGGATDALVKELNAKGYDVVHSALCSSQIALPSGLLLAVKRESGVKLEIEEIKVWEFKNLAGADAFSRKALMGAKIKLTTEEGEIDHLHVFNTHLQSSYDNKGYGEVRRDQVAAIVEKVKEWTGEDAEESAVIVCGDMNFGAKALEPTDNRLLPFADHSKGEGNEYDVQFDVFQKAGLIDPNVEAQKKDKGSFYELKKGPKKRLESVVDYVLLSERLMTNNFSSKIIDLDMENLSSDHCPLIQKIGMRAFQKQPLG